MTARARFAPVPPLRTHAVLPGTNSVYCEEVRLVELAAQLRCHVRIVFILKAALSPFAALRHQLAHWPIAPFHSAPCAPTWSGDPQSHRATPGNVPQSSPEPCPSPRSPARSPTIVVVGIAQLHVDAPHTCCLDAVLPRAQILIALTPLAEVAVDDIGKSSVWSCHMSSLSTG